MELSILYEGERFRVFSLDHDGEDDLWYFLGKLQEEDVAEHSRLMRRIHFIADHGVPNDETKMRPLGNELFEIKSSGGSRVICFYDQGYLILCTHGFKKPKPKRLSRYIKRAVELRLRYFAEKVSSHDL